MMEWFDATDEERKRGRALRALFGRDLQLFTYFLAKERPALSFRPGVMHDSLWQFDRKKRLIIKAGLDVSSRNGHVYLFEMLEEWEEEQWLDFISALIVLFKIDPDDLVLRSESTDLAAGVWEYF